MKARSAPPAAVRNPNCPSKRKQWSEKQMMEAMVLAQSGSVSMYCAADCCGVPRSTLADRLSGRVVHSAKPGPRPYLDASEETELVDYLFDSAKAGYIETRQQVKDIGKKSKGCSQIKLYIWRVVEKVFGEKTAIKTSSWELNSTCAHKCYKPWRQQYYELLKVALEEHDLLEHPEWIRSMDEVGMPFDPRPHKVAAPRGLKKVRGPHTGKSLNR